jgi:CheY-like chemotaxis protein
MKILSICIADNDSIRAETIRDILVVEGYSVENFKTETQALKAIVEKSFDLIFFSNDFSIDPISFVNKIKNFSPRSNLIVINTVSQETGFSSIAYAELGIRHYIDTPITSMNQIMDKVSYVESQIISEEDRLNTIFLLINDSISFAKGEKKPNSSDAKILIKNAELLSRLFNPISMEEGKIKGTFKDMPYFEAVRTFASVYEEGILEIASHSSSATIIIKNKAVVSVFVTPGIRGLKAFLRIAGWDSGSFTFKNKIPGDYVIEHDIAYIELSRLCVIAKKIQQWYQKFKNNIPPYELILGLNEKIPNMDMNLTTLELDVLMTVVDHKNVQDVLNYNSNMDIDIFDSLISLRKKGAIQIGA